MDSVIKHNVVAVMRRAHGMEESTSWFRVSLGLYYLRGLMTEEPIDFKRVDREFNRFIYQTIGRGHTITSVLQFMSGAGVMPVIESKGFIAAFAELCPQVPVNTIPFLLSLNLGVAKNISKVDIGGPLLDWIERQPPPAEAGAAREPDVL
jgi:hypothetical protein